MINLGSKDKVLRTVLVADDDQDDCKMIEEMFCEDRPLNSFTFVGNGEELMDYLIGKASFENRISYPIPDLILLDLNMPKKNGYEALKEIKADKSLKQTPIIIFTTSQVEQDVFKSYTLGVNSFVTKVNTLQSLIQLVKELIRYWFDLVVLPIVVRSNKMAPAIHWAH